MLEAARALGSALVVVLSNDRHNLKPYAVPSTLRRRRLQSLNVADRILVGAPCGFADSLRRVRPQVIALGYDQRLPDAETKDAVRKLRIKTVRLPWFPGKARTLLGEGHADGC